MKYTQIYADIHKKSNFTIQNTIFTALTKFSKDIEIYAETAYKLGYNGATFGSNISRLKIVKVFRSKLSNVIDKEAAKFLALDIFISMRNFGSKNARKEGIR